MASICLGLARQLADTQTWTPPLNNLARLGQPNTSLICSYCRAAITPGLPFKLAWRPPHLVLWETSHSPTKVWTVWWKSIQSSWKYWNGYRAVGGGIYSTNHREIFICEPRKRIFICFQSKYSSGNLLSMISVEHLQQTLEWGRGRDTMYGFNMCGLGWVSVKWNNSINKQQKSTHDML